MPTAAAVSSHHLTKGLPMGPEGVQWKRAVCSWVTASPLWTSVPELWNGDFNCHCAHLAGRGEDERRGWNRFPRTGCWAIKRPLSAQCPASEQPSEQREQPSPHIHPLPLDYFSQSHLIAAWLLAAARYIITCNYCPLKLSPGPCLLRCPGLRGWPADFPVRVTANGKRPLDRAGLTMCLARPPPSRLQLPQRWGLRDGPFSHGLVQPVSPAFLETGPLGSSQSSLSSGSYPCAHNTPI